MELTASDKLEIHELIARYNRAVDGGDAEAWANTFTEDGVFQSLLVGTSRGRKELLDFARGFLSETRYSPWAGGQHWIGSVIVDPLPEPDRASVFSYHIMFMPVDGVVQGVLMAAHDDVVEKTAAGWRFALRRLIPWPPGSDPQRWAPAGRRESR